VVLEKGEHIRLTATKVEGTARELTLWPWATFLALRAGSLVSIDFDGAQLEIVKVGEGYADAVVIDGGCVRSKGRHGPSGSRPPCADRRGLQGDRDRRPPRHPGRGAVVRQFP
jgi:hypothetical protein